MFQTDLIRRFAPVLLLALAGCQSMAPQESSLVKDTKADVQASATLDRTYWRVKSLVGRDVSGELNATVAFRNNRLSGRAGCNFFFAEYAEEENQLHVEGITTSKKICFAAVMQKEKLLLRILASVDRFEKDEAGNLVIYSRRSDVPVVFRPISRTEMPVLAVR